MYYLIENLMELLLIYLKKFCYSSRREWLKFDAVFMYLGIIISVASLVTTFIIFEGYETTLKKAILGVNSHIYFFNPGNLDFNQEDIDELTNFFETKKEIKTFSPITSGQAIASIGNRSRGCFFKSVDWKNNENASLYQEAVIEGTHQLKSENDIVIGKSLAAQLNVSIGDEIQIMSVGAPSVGNIGIRYPIKKMTIVGIFYSGMYDYDSRYVFMNHPTAKFFDNKNYDYNMVEVKLHDNYIEKADELTHRWERELNGKYQILSWIYFNGNLFSLLALEKWVLSIIVSFLIIVASFNVITTTIAAIYEKRTDIGILKTLGLGKHKIALIFLTQNLIITSVCIVLGIFAGISLGYLISYQTLITLRGEVYLLDKIYIYVDFWKMALIFAISLTIIIIALLIPLKQIIKLKEIDILRNTN
jgi:lipoprotein-releasing system permease protein